MSRNLTTGPHKRGHSIDQQSQFTWVGKCVDWVEVLFKTNAASKEAVNPIGQLA